MPEAAASVPSAVPAPQASLRIYVSVLIALVTVAMFINYVDRGNLATAAPLIKDELKLSNTQVGLLLSAFFWSYAFVQLFIGWLIERVSAHYVLALGLALWAVTTILTGLAGGFLALLALRILLGAGESVAYPCTSKLVAENLPPERLGAANGLWQSAIALGPAFGTLVGGLFMARFGWRAMFLVFGFVSLFWLWPWLVLTRSTHARTHHKTRERPPTYLAIIRHRAVWGTTLGHFANAYAWYFVISWLPIYLVKDRGFSIPQMAQLGALAYLVNAVASILNGWLADRWILSGASINRVRKTVAVTGPVGLAVCMLASAPGVTMIAIVSLVTAGMFFGMTNCTNFVIAQTIAGPRAAGKWVALQNCIANLGGILAPIVTGIIVDRTGNFGSAFVLTAAVLVAGAFSWAFIVPRVASIDLAQERQGAAVTSQSRFS